jgi:6-phosphogluconolactonase (cycloisomerase 2 family)
MMPIEVRAGFTTCNIKAGKTVMQFELDPEYRHMLSQLAGVTGSQVYLTIDSPQQTLFVDRESGEVLEGQETVDEIIEEYEVYEDDEDDDDDSLSLPPAAYEYDEFEDEAA